MGFSSILDISSFFIGMIINLIFVALMCYYFKRKYDYLYDAQCEQSKVIYQLLHKNMHSQSQGSACAPSMDFTCDPLVKVNTVHSDSESESDDEDECEDENTPVFSVEKYTQDQSNAENLILELEEVKPEELKTIQLSDLTVEPVSEPLDMNEITINLETEPDTSETNYSKMSMKQLKEVLTSKGIKPKNNIKKEELIELITKDSS